MRGDKIMSHTYEEERERFYCAVERRRRQLGKDWKDVAAEAGVKPSVPRRIGRGQEVRSDAVFRLSAWLHATKPPNGGLTGTA